MTAVDDDVHGPDKQITVTATVAGPPGLAAPAPRTLTISDDDEEETNIPPVFSRRSYEFQLKEERDGRAAEVLLGTVAATDPENEALTYTLERGDASRFAVGPSSGNISYVGPGEDAESGPDRYALRRRTSPTSTVTR